MAEIKNDAFECIRSDRDIIVKSPFSDGRIYFKFTEISRAHQSFSALITVLIEHDKEGFLPSYRQRLDLNSHSAVEGFRRSLQNSFEFKTIKWGLIINKAFNAVVDKFDTEQKPINFAGRECEKDEFLFSPFLQKNANNMVFGDSEVGKSYFCLRLAASLATGISFMGFSCNEAGKKTLYIDYEDSDTIFNKRLFEVSSGMGVAKSSLDEHIWWYRPEGSLRDISEVVARMVAEYGFDLIIIDAGSNAAGGSPNDEQRVIEMFNALETIPCTRLIIHHEPKDTLGKDANKAYYGTVFWRALTRIAWRLSLEESEGDGTLIKAVIVKRSNMGKVEPFYYRQKWEMGELGSNYGPVSFTPEEKKVVSPEEKIIDALTKKGELSKGALMEITGIKESYFKELSQKMKEAGKIDVESKGRGAVWTIPANKTPNKIYPPKKERIPPNDENTF